MITLFADGGSRGNPGPSGAGAVAFDQDGRRVVEVSDFLGVATNNIAEYEAILRGLAALKDAYPKGHFQGVPVIVKMDSKLVVEQMKGAYKVRHPNLIPRHRDIKELISQYFGNVEFVHVPRAQNADADMLANKAMDSRF